MIVKHTMDFMTDNSCSGISPSDHDGQSNYNRQVHCVWEWERTRERERAKIKHYIWDLLYYYEKRTLFFQFIMKLWQDNLD